nr:EF-hand calcium-binding domain-containing protein 11 isoform X2 [Macaca nemestrina]XP_011715562.1 EF-hand calcium-binding domain-containing protein 11 isoform X2 [Macaca nemestrina]
MLFGYKPSKIEVDSVMSSVNPNTSGILLEGFLNIVRKKKEAQRYRNEVRHIFTAFDTYYRGFLTLEDFKKAFRQVAPKLPERTVLEVFSSRGWEVREHGTSIWGGPSRCIITWQKASHGEMARASFCLRPASLYDDPKAPDVNDGRSPGCLNFILGYSLPVLKTGALFMWLFCLLLDPNLLLVSLSLLCPELSMLKGKSESLCQRDHKYSTKIL